VRWRRRFRPVVHRLSPSAGACGQVRAASRTVPGTLALLACRHVRRRPSSDTGREEGSRDAGDDIRPGEQGGRSRVADADLAVLVLLGPQPSWRQREERLLGRRSGSSGVRIPLGGPPPLDPPRRREAPYPTTAKVASLNWLGPRASSKPAAGNAAGVMPVTGRSSTTTPKSPGSSARWGS